MAYYVKDAYGSTIGIESSVVTTGERQVVTIGSAIGTVPVTFSGGQVSVSGVGLFNVNHTGNGSILVLVPGSVATAPSPGSVSGVGLFNVNHIGNGSIQTVSLGSIATAPQPASVSGVGLFNVNHVGSGSVFAVLRDSSVSGVGLFNVNHTGSGSVISTNQVTRNDGVASFLGVNLTPRYLAGDSAGRVLVKPFAPEEARVASIISTNSGTSTSLLAAGGAGLRTYITDAFVTNTSSTATLVTFQDGDNSVIGRTIAPATGGSNIVGLTTPMKTGGSAHIVSVTLTPATSTIGITALGYYAP